MSTNQLGNMEQIRELMFGPQIRMFEEELNKMNNTLQTIDEKLSDKINKLEAKLISEHEASTTIIEQKIKTLSTTMQEGSIDTKEQLVKYEKKINQSLEDVQEVFEAQVSLLKNEHAQSKIATSNELESLKSSISTLLNEQIDNMKNIKVSKDDLSAMLLDFAMKINDSSIEDSLQDITQEEDEKK